MPEVKELEERKPELREWTVMFCFATDNPLAPGTISQLKAIKNAGFQRDVNVIAQFDPHTLNMPVHIFDVNMVERLKLKKQKKEASNIGFAANDPFVRNLVLDKLWDANIAKEIKAKMAENIDYNPPIPSVTMSSEQNPKESLSRFLNFCRINYPARHYMLIILAHGIVVGNDLFMFDEHGSDDNAQQHALTLTELGDVLDRFKDQISKDEPCAELELIGFHSCSMSGAEVAFELRGKANYMMASQGPIYVGSWPYRQILIRLFKDMEDGRIPKNGLIAASLVDRLKSGGDQPSIHLRGVFNGNGEELLERHRVDDSPSPKLVGAVADMLDDVITGRPLCDQPKFQNVRFSRKTRSRIAKHKISRFQGKDLQDLNLRVLEDAFPEELNKAKIRAMFIKMFEYTIYNSFDFQLAGYSADLTLCDLNRVHQVQQPMTHLATALREGLALDSDHDSTIQNAILLAHWEAQSYYDENFTDLYDFCFRLAAKLKPKKRVRPKTGEALAKYEIFEACEEVMHVLKRGFKGDDFGPIVRCVFSGPDYQYSHGLSVFFPWAEPIGSNMWDKQYEYYELNQRTGWRSFLKTYFDETMRDTQHDEHDRRESRSKTIPREDKALLALLERMSAGVLSGIEQLAGKTGAGDPLGDKPIKTGAGDPTGGSSGCVVIKNYPHFTGLQLRGLNGKAKSRGHKAKSRGRNGKLKFLGAASGSLLKGLTEQMTPPNGDSDN